MAHGRLQLSSPIAIVPVSEVNPVVLDCSYAACSSGVSAGMPLAQALGHCPNLKVITLDSARVELAAECFVERLEVRGAAVQPISPGRALFDAAPLVLLYDGLSNVLERIIHSFNSDQVRIGAGANPFVAWVAAQNADAGSWLHIKPSETRQMLAKMPLDLLPIKPKVYDLMHALGLITLGDIAALDAHHVADRLGKEGLLLHSLARGEDSSSITPRVLGQSIAEELSFPDYVTNISVLENAAAVLVERLVRHPHCMQYAPRSIVVSCTLAGSKLWSSKQRVLRTPTRNAERIMLALMPALQSISAPVESIKIAFESWAPHITEQQKLPLGEAWYQAKHGERTEKGIKHVQDTLGASTILHVLELSPQSQVPEQHALLVPYVGNKKEMQTHDS